MEHNSNSELSKLVTCIITTSPTQSNPGTSMIKWLFRSFDQVNGMKSIRKIIVCDGCRVRNPKASPIKKGYRSGWVNLQGHKDYVEYKKRLVELSLCSDGPWLNTTVLELETRHGFGFAVEAALAHVKTDFVMIIQHDRFFLRKLDLDKVVSALRKESRVKSLYLSTHNTANYVEKMRSRFRADITELAILRDGLKFYPMLVWLDSTHIARTKWYKEFVFDPANELVAKGGFIEDKFGQVQLKRFKENGLDSHATFGTFILPEVDKVESILEHAFAKQLVVEGCILPVEEKIPWVRHISGRSFLEVSQRLQKMKISR